MRPRLLIVGTSQDVILPGAYDDRKWWIWALIQMGWPHEIAGISAASGRTISQALTAFPTEVTPLLANGPIDEAWVNLGQNDFGDGPTAAANLLLVDQYVAKLQAAGIGRIVWLTANPRNPMTSALQQGLTTWNYGLMERGRSWATQGAEFQCIDVGAVTRDTASTTGAAIASHLFDDRHLNATGAMLAGQYFAGTQTGNYTQMDDYPISAVDYYGLNTTSQRLLANPMLTGSGGTNSGGVSGAVPAGWTMGGGAGTTIVGTVTCTTTGPRQRNWLNVVFSGSAAAANSGFALAYAYCYEPITDWGTAGTTKIRARIPFTTSGLSPNVANLSVSLQGFVADWSSKTFYYATTLTSGDVIGQLPAAGTMEIPEFVVPTGTAHIAFAFTVVWNTGPTTGTIQLAEPLLEIAS